METKLNRLDFRWISLTNTCYPFKEDGVEFKSVLQYMCYRKAIFFGDAETAEEVLLTKDVSELFRLENKIKCYPVDCIEGHLLAFLKDGFQLKLEQYSFLQTRLDEAGASDIIDQMVIYVAKLLA